MTSRAFSKRVDLFLRGAHFSKGVTTLSLPTEIHYSDSELFERSLSTLEYTEDISKRSENNQLSSELFRLELNTLRKYEIFIRIFRKYFEVFAHLYLWA